MNNPGDVNDIAAFYYGAILKFDFDSDDVDTILEAAGLSVENDSIQECKTAVLRYVDTNTVWTPVRPVTNFTEAIERTKYV